MGKKSTLAFCNTYSSPPKLDFGVCFLLILLSGQVELNPGPSSPGNQNFRHSKKIKNWRTLILNCQSLRGKVEAFQSSVDYF